MAITQTDLDTLETAIASGVRVVRYADRTVEYHSLDDMLKAREFLRRKLNQTDNGRRYAVTSKGL